jgi:hypothetical protein
MPFQTCSNTATKLSTEWATQQKPACIPRTSTLARTSTRARTRASAPHTHTHTHAHAHTHFSCCGNTTCTVGNCVLQVTWRMPIEKKFVCSLSNQTWDAAKSSALVYTWAIGRTYSLKNWNNLRVQTHSVSTQNKISKYLLTSIHPEHGPAHFPSFRLRAVV